jgi:hypothetical protein
MKSLKKFANNEQQQQQRAKINHPVDHIWSGRNTIKMIYNS